MSDCSDCSATIEDLEENHNEPMLGTGLGTEMSGPKLLPLARYWTSNSRKTTLITTRQTKPKS